MTKKEFAEKTRKLLELARSIEAEMEASGFRSTNSEIGVVKEQFFHTTVPSIVAACQSLARGDPGEKAELRLQRDFPFALNSMPQFRKALGTRKDIIAWFDELESIVKYLHESYRNISVW